MLSWTINGLAAAGVVAAIALGEWPAVVLWAVAVWISNHKEEDRHGQTDND